MNRLSLVSCKTSNTLLELAAKNDIDGFTRLLNRESTSVDQVGLWYVGQKGSKQVVRDKRTPLMVAAMYGSLDVMKKILCLSRCDVNRLTGYDQTTALHCAASCGSLIAVEAVKLLLAHGADPNLMDANCLRPVDMIVDSPEYPDLKHALHAILGLKDGVLNMKPNFESKREYHVDPSLPKIKNSTSYDEFMMYSFKVIPCSHVQFHIWKECPFVHPGERARRRDPHKYRYSSVPCLEFRNGTCRSGDLCEYAHGSFEWGMHPAKYRTQLCKDGTACNRSVCFFAHNQQELRLLDVKSPSPSGNEIFSLAMRARGLNLAPDYQHGQSQVRSFNLQEPGSTSVDPWSRWGSSSEVPDFPWIQSSSLSDQLMSPRSMVSKPHMNTGNQNLVRSREYVANPSPFMDSSVGPWSPRDSSSGKADRAVKREELDLSWMHSLPDETPHERASRLKLEQETDETEYIGRK